VAPQAGKDRNARRLGKFAIPILPLADSRALA
jgi:hypothetical protein